MSIVSPFITLSRTQRLMPLLSGCIKRGVRIRIIVTPPSEKDRYFKSDSKTLSQLQEAGVEIITREKFHKKIILVDRSYGWVGSLNILSQYQGHSTEIMTPFRGSDLVKQLFDVVKLPLNSS